MGYSGALCQIDEDVCGHQTPCRNGGTCTNTGSDKYFCQCSVGYKGHNCDVDIDQCVSSPCLNAATCHVSKIVLLNIACRKYSVAFMHNMEITLEYICLQILCLFMCRI